MAQERYIQVMLPLKLEWEPYYKLPEGMEAALGDRVRVVFANAFYVGAVSAVNVNPSLEPSRILPVEALEKDLPSITPDEMAFWRKVADYYLCTVGEVYKAAYPGSKNHKSRLKLPERSDWKEAPALSPQADAVRTALEKDKPVLLWGKDREEIYLNLSLKTLREGKSVLYLVPEVDTALFDRVREEMPSALLYHSALTPGKKKLVAEVLRKGEPQLVLGTRSALFLPHRNLGLVIVDQEQDPAYKQEAPAPRYHARESAIMLALVHGAGVLLGSETPSLDSIYNAQCSRFTQVDLKENVEAADKAPLELINTGAEFRKKGMAGSFSLKLLGLIQKTLEAGEQVLLIAPRRYYASGRKVEDELLEFCPKARIGLLDGTPEDRANTLQAFSQGELDILLGNTLTTRGFQSEKLSLVALVETDGLLSRQDFRADERAFQLLEQFRGCCRRMVVQTRDPHHPVFQILKEGGDPAERLLQERRVAGYPPFTRMIKILLKDSNEKRLEYLSKELSREIAPLGIPVEGPYSPSYAKEEPLREIRLLLPRDKALSARKAQIGPIVTAFEQARKYPGHIIIDVDPV